MSVLNKVSDDNNNCFSLCKNVSAGLSHNSHGQLRRERYHQILSKQEDGLVITEDRQKKKEMDTILCQGMDKLTLEERKKQQDIIHGIDETIEDATLLDRSLQDLDLHLKSMKHNSMYEVAERIDSEYVNARAFRVMFLRANEYDAKSSADQMLRFFESKYQLFGIEKLVEDITLADLGEDGVACLKTGCIQVAGKDRSGRQVIVHFAGALGRLESWLRVQYFVKMKALEDEETQLRGIVSIWCALSNVTAMPNGKGYLEGFRAANALPQKKQAIHVCVDDMMQRVMCNVLAGVKIVKGDMVRPLLVHYGSPLECQYQLSTYGIQPQSIPLDGNGRIDLRNHLNWIESSCTMEDKFCHSLQPQPETSVSGTITPLPLDVLFTGGKTISHPGNQRFHSVIKNYSQAYDNGGEDEAKRLIANTIIETIQESGGRFLQRQQTESGEMWKIVSPEILRKKIMQTFRNRRSKADASKRRAADLSGGALIAGEPLPNDVIFARSQRNPGSELLHRLIKEHFEEYESLGRGVKIVLVETIMKTIKETGGRFLQQAEEQGRWLELSHESARERISKYFRNHRRIQKKR